MEVPAPMTAEPSVGNSKVVAWLGTVHCARIRPNSPDWRKHKLQRGFRERAREQILPTVKVGQLGRAG
jgi:hypothetical protein